jgi:hypothetical protein
VWSVTQRAFGLLHAPGLHYVGHVIPAEAGITRCGWSQNHLYPRRHSVCRGAEALSVYGRPPSEGRLTAAKRCLQRSSGALRPERRSPALPARNPESLAPVLQTQSNLSRHRVSRGAEPLSVYHVYHHTPREGRVIEAKPCTWIPDSAGMIRQRRTSGVGRAGAEALCISYDPPRGGRLTKRTPEITRVRPRLAEGRRPAI